jgi:creatinine amidohydrolase
MVLDLLQATCDEIGRNGFHRIVIVRQPRRQSPQLLRYFIQSQLASATTTWCTCSILPTTPR